jgi:hypothetical protein
MSGMLVTGCVRPTPESLSRCMRLRGCVTDGEEADAGAYAMLRAARNLEQTIVSTFSYEGFHQDIPGHLPCQRYCSSQSWCSVVSRSCSSTSSQRMRDAWAISVLANMSTQLGMKTHRKVSGCIPGRRKLAAGCRQLR